MACDGEALGVSDALAVGAAAGDAVTVGSAVGVRASMATAVGIGTSTFGDATGIAHPAITTVTANHPRYRCRPSGRPAGARRRTPTRRPLGAKL